MKIMITHPFCWPHVRRGTERHIDGLARYLNGKGHEVTTVSSWPGDTKTEVTDGGKRILHRQWWTPLMGRLRIQPTHMFCFTSMMSMLSEETDIVHSFFYTDALAALIAKQRRRFSTILHINGAPVTEGFYRFLPPERPMFRKAIRSVDRFSVCSQFARTTIRDRFGVDPLVFVPPVDTDAFPFGNGPENGRPVLLSAADFDVRRKGLRVLIRAFARVREEVPEAMLYLSGRMSASVQKEVLGQLPEAAKKDIVFLGLGNVENLPALYRRASVLVLPSMWEASGSVMFEAWASGTPVVVTRHAGLPEFLNDKVGVMFDPLTDGEETMNADGLAESIVKGLELARQQGTRMACRAHAESYSWQALGPDIEALYRALL